MVSLVGVRKGRQPGGVLCGCMMEASLLVDTIVSKVHLGKADQQGGPALNGAARTPVCCQAAFYNLPDLTLLTDSYKQLSRTEEMAQRLGALAALPEVLSSIPTNYMVAHSHW